MDDAPELPLPRRREPVVSTGEIVTPAREGSPDQVRLGSVVVVRDAEGESRYQIVMPEEADPGVGKISWRTPLAQALLQRRTGERLQFRNGELELVAVQNQ